MTDPTTDAAPSEDPAALRACAIDALTALARQGYDTDHGWRRIDFAGELAAVLAAVAANVGGGQVLLAGRPGSWEAAAVETLVGGTVGRDDEDLARYRTEPITVWVDAQVQLEEQTDGTWFDAWSRLQAAAEDRYEEAYEVALDRHAGAARIVPEHERHTLQAELDAGEPLTEERKALRQRLAAEEHWLLSADADLAAARRLAQAVSDAQEARERDYAAALFATMQAGAAARGYGVELVASEDYDQANWIGNELEAEARAATPVPPVPTLDELR